MTEYAVPESTANQLRKSVRALIEEHEGCGAFRGYATGVRTKRGYYTIEITRNEAYERDCDEMEGKRGARGN